MAKLHKESDPNLIECYGGTSGRKLIKAIRRSGQIVKLGTIIGHVKPGVTLAQYRDAMQASRNKETGAPTYSDVRITLAASNMPSDTPIVSQAKADARVKAKERATAKAAELQAREEAFLAEHGIDAYVSACLKARRTPGVRGEARYLYDMARFNSGQTGGYLGTAIMARYHLERDVTPERIAELDAQADRIAESVYGHGASMAAAVVWDKALHG